VNHLDYLGQITIGFYGAKSTTGIGNSKLSEINAMVGGERLFGSRSDGEAFDYLLKKLDEEKGNGDGYYGDGDPEEDIKIYGWSWGGITAIKLARKIKESKRFCRKAVKVLYTIDPDEFLYANPTVPDNVISFINRYQTKGTGGEPLDSHGERRNCEAGVGCENQKDLNETGDERTTKYPGPGSRQEIINHHTIFFEIADEVIGKLK